MITLAVSGIEKLTRLAEQYPQLSEQYINQAIARALVRVRGGVQTEAPFGVSGLLRGNWQSEIGRFEGTLRALAPYAADVEYGTPPHSVPIAQLAPWAKKKGIPVWAVANAIKLRGTKANPFLQRAVDVSADGIQQEFNDALARIASELSR